MLEGTCLCNALQYQIEGPFYQLIHCHCSICRKHSGNGFMTWAVVPSDGFRWLGDGTAPELIHYRTSDHSERLTCAVCGSAAPVVMPERGLAIVPAANLQGDLPLTPQAHWFVESKACWEAITDTLPQFAEFPPGIGGVPLSRPAPEPPPPGGASGSCLCGDVAYEFDGRPAKMLMCHCSRCQRARSAPHATNLLLPLAQFRWRRGEQWVRTYKVPDAKFFTTAFCAHCGGTVPVGAEARGRVVLPAGTLDSDPGMRPQAHVFAVAHKSWFEITGDLPQFEAFPPA